LIAVGVRFDDRVTGKTDTFASQAKIVHIDIDPTSIRKNIPVTIPVVGDCKASLEHLNRLLEEIDLKDPSGVGSLAGSDRALEEHQSPGL
jgi:acetolactate synthase-1/2/3 large subunit